MGLAGILTSSSVSEHEREKKFLILGRRSSSVVGGVNGRSFGILPSFGTFILPLGFLWALTRRPAGLIGVRRLGVAGAWILDIWVIRVARLGGCRGAGVQFLFIWLSSVYVFGLGRARSMLITLGVGLGFFFLVGFLASAAGLYSRGMSRGGPWRNRGTGEVERR